MSGDTHELVWGRVGYEQAGLSFRPPDQIIREMTTRLPPGPGPRVRAEGPSKMTGPIRVLVVDDEDALRRTVQRMLEARGMLVTSVDGGPAALERIDADAPDVVLVDYMMPGMDGMQVIQRIKDVRPDVEVIMMSASASLETAIAAKKAGAYYFLRKPFESNDALVLSVMLAAEHRWLSHHARSLEEQLDAREQFGEMIGTSKGMLEVHRIIHGVANTHTTILILGESGTGKELVARALHASSPRAQAPMVALNCAAIPKDLVESELFGHVRGAFTGAQTARGGVFEAANTGTLFLDEVGDLPLPAQASLLRALQSGEIKRVGSDETRTVDVRVIAATNVDLKTKIAAGTFRADLFYRLNVIAVHLPALRERGDDVLLLADHFLTKLERRLQRESKVLADDARRALREYEWPGNVRELEHALEHAFILSQGGVIRAADLPFRTSTDDRALATSDVAELARASDGSPGEGLAVPVALFELTYAEAKRQAQGLFDEAYMTFIMKRTNGNLSEAARQAGLDRSNFRRIARKARDG